jgi:hypothetical protein
MNTATLSPESGFLAGWAVRGGLRVASWGLQRASRRTDREHQLDRIHARAAAEAALEERDSLIRRAGCLPF